MQPIIDYIESWASGVVTTLESDAIPASASPRGRNSALHSAGGERAAAAKRRGISARNATAISGTPAILGQTEYKRLAAGVFTRYHLLVSDGGRIDRLEDAGTLTSVHTTAFQSGTAFPDFAQANNLIFIANGQTGGTFSGRLKYNGTNVQNFGITRPTVGSMAGAVGAAGSHNGTYELRVTFYNSNTGHESSISNTASATVVATNDQIDWTNVPTSSDTQVTHRYLYVRNIASMANFYRAGEIANNSGTSATTNISDAALLLQPVGPDTAENDPPPAGIKYLAFHRERMFAADDTFVYYSKIGLPEAFDPDAFERVGRDDGQKVIGLLSYKGVLLIFKQASIWAIDGDDPDTWEIPLMDSSIGCTSHRSIVQAEGQAFWWSEQGPMTIIASGTAVPVGGAVPIGQTLIAPTVGPDEINFNQLGAVVAAVDFPRQRVLFGVPEFEPEGEPTSTRNNIILPYNYRLQRWESDRWDPIDVASFGVADDADGIPWVNIGGYKGQVFRVWDSDNDGVAASTTMSGNVTSATSTTLTDSTAAFDTTGAGLAQRYVYAIDSIGNIQRRRIGSNTATTLTLDTSLTWAVTPNANYTYVVGGINWEWDTYWFLHDLPALKKRYTFLYCQLKTPAAATLVNADIFLNYANAYSSTILFQVNPGGGVWDAATWDVSRWADQAAANFRLRIARTGIAIRVRFRNYFPDQPLILLKAGIAGEVLTDKIG